MKRKFTGIRLQLLAVAKTEASPRFLQAMLDAMGLSFLKYGAMKLGYPKNVDAIASLEVRLQRYKDTGNKRWLVDIANFAMIEAMHPRHLQAHEPEHDQQSPGRVTTGGTLTEAANTPEQEAIRNPQTAPSWMGHSGD